MQTFEIVLKVVVNSILPVSEAEVYGEIADLVSNFESGEIDILECEEKP